MRFNYKYFTKVFEPLGYFVFNRNLSGPDSEWFDIYVKGSQRGLEWFGEFSPVIVDNKCIGYKLNTHCYRGVVEPKSVIEEISEYNKTRILPAYCYSPTLRKSYAVFEAFTWYMKTLGFERPRWDEPYSRNYAVGKSDSETMVLRNMYGEVISRITCYVDDTDADEIKGNITRFVGNGWSWVESPYTSFEEMIGAINSIVEPEVLINAAQSISITENMTNDRTDKVDYNAVDGNLNSYTTNAKNIVKAALTDALKKLN